ncbi:MAG: hypothetical protein H8E55_33985 [Pelagibacterales bacterium]|nr:hypothetical protein [Pelagibacterales bacterium]
MENNNKATNEIAALSQKEGTQESSESADRLNIDDINRRNAEEKKKEKRSSYIIKGIVAGLLIIVGIIFFN